MGSPRTDSKLHIHFTLTENVQGQVLAEFEVVSAAEGDSESLEDTADAIADYLSTRRARKF